MRFASLVAFALFVCTAFDWTAPGLDRAGMAALAFGLLALSVGAALSPLSRAHAPPEPEDPFDMLDGFSRDFRERLSLYETGGGVASEAAPGAER